MDLYSFCLWLGFAGLVAMAVLGAAGGHGSHGHAHGHSPHGADAHGFHLHGSGQHDLHLHAHATHHHGGPHPSTSSPAAHGHAAPHHTAGQRLLGWLSPRVWFSIALGVGATGLLTAPYLHAEPLRAACALAGGIGLEKLIVSPLWNTLMRFGSNPARTLESAVLEEATALTAFDRDGCGLVAIDLDGHEMRVLARLKTEQRAERVRAGDRLIVEQVDAARGQCVVSRPLSL